MYLSIPIAAKKEKIDLHGNNLEKKYNVLNFVSQYFSTYQLVVLLMIIILTERYGRLSYSIV